eukprot:6149020-Pleurochrysis_carterae.AAC.6
MYAAPLDGERSHLGESDAVRARGRVAERREHEHERDDALHRQRSRVVVGDVRAVRLRRRSNNAGGWVE